MVITGIPRAPVKELDIRAFPDALIVGIVMLAVILAIG
jgi:hypothetical protein